MEGEHLDPVDTTGASGPLGGWKRVIRATRCSEQTTGERCSGLLKRPPETAGPAGGWIVSTVPAINHFRWASPDFSPARARPSWNVRPVLDQDILAICYGWFRKMGGHDSIVWTTSIAIMSYPSDIPRYINPHADPEALIEQAPAKSPLLQKLKQAH